MQEAGTKVRYDAGKKMTAIRSFCMLVLAAAIARVAKSVPNEKLDVPPEYVAKAEAVVQNARPLISQMWSEMGKTFAMFEPRLQAYRERIESGCGPMALGNAGYCAKDNIIYYDPAFLGFIMWQAGKSTGTDGSYAVVAVLEHELGHALAWRRATVGTALNTLRGDISTYYLESYADCATGAMSARARQLDLIGAAEAGEAEKMLAALADPQFEGEDPHGDSASRLAAFHLGYQQGNGNISACKVESFETRFHVDSVDTTESCSDYGRKYGLQAQLRAAAVGICK
jgi:predicted metalloprotease